MAGSSALGSGNLLGALELQRYDGPWTTPGGQRKLNAMLRYSEGDRQADYSVTGSVYHSQWNNQTDVPERAIAGTVDQPFRPARPLSGHRCSRQLHGSPSRANWRAGGVSWVGWYLSTPEGFGGVGNVDFFYSSIALSIRLVRRLDPMLPFLMRHTLTRALLLARFSPHPGRVSLELALDELRNYNASPLLR